MGNAKTQWEIWGISRMEPSSISPQQLMTFLHGDRSDTAILADVAHCVQTCSDSGYRHLQVRIKGL